MKTDKVKTWNTSQILLGLLVILIIASGFRLWGIGNGLPYSQVTDESEGISASLNLAAGTESRYPYIRTGWEVLQWSVLAPYYAIMKLSHSGFSNADFESLYFTHRDTFILLVRGMTAGLTIIAVLLIFFAGLALTHTYAGGFLTALLMAIQPFDVYIAHTALSDNMALLGVTMALTGAVYISQRGFRWAYALGGFGLTLAMLGHLQTVFVVITLILAHLFYWWRQPKRPFSLLATRWLWAFAAFAVSHVILNPYLIIDPAGVLRDIQSIFTERFSSNSNLSDRLSNLQTNLLLPLIPMRPYLAIVSLLGIGLALIRRNFEPLILTVFAAIFTVSLMPAPNPRITFWLEVSAPVVLLAVYALVTVYQADYRWLRRIAIGIGIVVISWAALETTMIDRDMAAPNTRNLAYDYVTQTIPAGSRIMIGEMFTYSVALTRTSESIQQLQSLVALPPSYTFQLSHPALALQPQYDLFSSEYQKVITDNAHWWQFVKDYHIQYVIEADYCGGQAQYTSTSALEFPVIDDQTRTQIHLIKAFSPFSSESCEQIIESRTPMERMNIWNWQRIGPIIRIYQIPSTNVFF